MGDPNYSILNSRILIIRTPKVRYRKLPDEHKSMRIFGFGVPGIPGILFLEVIFIVVIF